MNRINIYTQQIQQDLEAFYPGGHARLLEIASNPLLQVEGVHDGLHSTSREDTSQGPLNLPIVTIPPEILAKEAPWVKDWYRGPLLDKAREFAGRLVAASAILANFPLINVHRGRGLAVGESYESHVDSNYPTGLYFLGEADRTIETGGALVISAQGDVPNRAEVIKDSERYYPKIGEFTLMNGYGVTHFD